VAITLATTLATHFDCFEPITEPAADWSAVQNWSAGQLPGTGLTGVIEGVWASIDPGISLNANILLHASTSPTGLANPAGLVGNGGALAFGTADHLSIVGTADLFAQDSLVNQGVIALAPAAAADIVVDLGAISGLPGAAPPYFANSGLIQINQGATLALAGTELENSGTIMLNSGTLTINDGAVTTQSTPDKTATEGTISLAGTATADFNDTVSAQIFVFAPNARATLSLDDATLGTTLTLPGFGTTDELRLPNLPNATVELTGSLATLIPIGTLNAQNPACFAEGTEILTPRGHVPVEQLAPGDHIITRNGTIRPIRWVGHRRITHRGQPLPPAFAPVRILADAFGPGMPRRALSLSPDHGIYFDGVLIQAKHLINGATITNSNPPLSVHYFHLELDRHDIVLAEGLACETYLDTGNRSAFENGAPRFGRRKRWDRDAAAPLCTQGKTLQKLRTSLLARAQESGFSRHFVTDLAVMVDGIAAKPLPGTALTRHFSLPQRQSDHAEIRSAHFAPAAFDPASDDWRQLGIALTSLRIGRTRFAPDHLARSGFHPRDAGDPALWTNGTGIIALPQGAQRITLEIAGLPLAWRLAGRSHGQPP
jgi:hypothetical protein